MRAALHPGIPSLPIGLEAILWTCAGRRCNCTSIGLLETMGAAMNESHRRAAASLSTIEKGRAPFAKIERDDGADLVWDVANSEALSRGDLVMSKVDGSLLGGVIDRTWAILQTQKLSRPRVLPVGQVLYIGRPPGAGGRRRPRELSDRR
jgi:hypothetical protein